MRYLKIKSSAINFLDSGDQIVFFNMEKQYYEGDFVSYSTRFLYFAVGVHDGRP